MDKIQNRVCKAFVYAPTKRKTAEIKPIRFPENRNIVAVFRGDDFINHHKTETMTKIQAITADNKLRQATTENPVTLRAMRDLGLYATITNNRQRQGRLPVFGSLDCPFRAVRLPLWEKAGSVRPRRGRALDRSFPHPATDRKSVV